VIVFPLSRLFEGREKKDDRLIEEIIVNGREVREEENALFIRGTLKS